MYKKIMLAININKKNNKCVCVFVISTFKYVYY